MPSMYEIYDKHSIQYDELVNHEDYQKNLDAFLNDAFIGIDTVIELGTGTGRLTKLYANKVQRIICTERAQHMINKAKINLAEFKDKIDFVNIDTRNISQLKTKADCIIEGWAVGHTAIDEYHRLDEFLSKLFKDFKTLLNSNGKIILIETMGTNVDEPKIPTKELEDLYNELETTYAMKKQIIQTDYKFVNTEEAKRICGFFFGHSTAANINSNIVNEYTGIWTS